MGDLYLSGGEQRIAQEYPRTVFRSPEEWHSLKKALVLRLDADTGKVVEKFEYVPPSDACSNDKPAISFKAATLSENRLYTCTSTEVIIFKVPGFQRVGYLSLPCFNDLHHVVPTP